MTEKRFTVTRDFEEHHRQIRDNGHIIMGCFVEPQAEVIVNLLNELHEENKELKNKINTYKSANKLQQETIRLLREDNGLINITNVELFKLEDEDD